MELAQPSDRREVNFGTTTIITGEKMIPGKEIGFTISKTKIEVSNTHRFQYEDLRDRQRELYGDDPV